MAIGWVQSLGQKANIVVPEVGGRDRVGPSPVWARPSGQANVELFPLSSFLQL